MGLGKAYLRRREEVHRLRSLGVPVGTRFRLTSPDNECQLAVEIVGTMADGYEVEFDSGHPEFRKVGSATLTPDELTALIRG